jgi:hypothetical protein
LRARIWVAVVVPSACSCNVGVLLRSTAKVSGAILCRIHDCGDAIQLLRTTYSRKNPHLTTRPPPIGDRVRSAMRMGSICTKCHACFSVNTGHMISEMAGYCLVQLLKGEATMTSLSSRLSPNPPTDQHGLCQLESISNFFFSFSLSLPAGLCRLYH